MKSNTNCKCTSSFCETAALTCPALINLPNSFIFKEARSKILVVDHTPILASFPSLDLLIKPSFWCKPTFANNNGALHDSSQLFVWSLTVGG